jgi:hypothetical protein
MISFSIAITLHSWHLIYGMWYEYGIGRIARLGLKGGEWLVVRVRMEREREREKEREREREKERERRAWNVTSHDIIAAHHIA